MDEKNWISSSFESDMIAEQVEEGYSRLQVVLQGQRAPPPSLQLPI